eukprot:SAG11_NODE_1524_length_4746_cov_5.271358_3_plen_74_part_00
MNVENGMDMKYTHTILAIHSLMMLSSHHLSCRGESLDARLHYYGRPQHRTSLDQRWYRHWMMIALRRTPNHCS